MRRKFYTKKDYQFMPSVGAKQAIGVYSEPTYRVRIPTQLRLEPWDYDFELPNLHGIQLDYVHPPGGNHDEDDEMNEAFEQRGAIADAGMERAEVMEVEGRGQRRGRDEADLNPDLVDRVGPVRRHRRAEDRQPRTPAPRTPGLAVEAARTSRNSALRVARTRRNLDFQQETQTVRNRNQMRYNPPAGLRAGLPPRKRPPEP